MSPKCSICGCEYDIFVFKSGFICEDCLRFIHDAFDPEARVRALK